MDFLKANFPNEELLQILKLYPFESSSVVISPLTGIANNNYRLKGNYFDIAVKVYSHGQSDKDKVRKELEAMLLFKQNGIKIPDLIKGRNGEVLQQYKGFNIVSTKFIEGAVFSDIEFTDTKMFEVGKIVAKVEKTAQTLNIAQFETFNFREEFDYVSQNLDYEIKLRSYTFDLSVYNQHLNFIETIIGKLDESPSKQFLHKDIWPWNLIDSSDGIYLLDFNDWSIGTPIIEIAVPILEFGMIKSPDLNVQVAKSILDGYKAEKLISFSPKELWEAILFICYLYFPYNVIQSDDPFDSEIYLKRINTLIKNPDIFEQIF